MTTKALPEMLSARWLLPACSMIFLLHAPAHADPMPPSVIGTWTDLPGCVATGHRMIFSADAVTVVEDDGSRVSVPVETTGTIEDRLQIRVTQEPPGRPPDAGPKVGDVLVIRRTNDELHLIGEGSGDAIHDVTDATPLHRCEH